MALTSAGVKSSQAFSVAGDPPLGTEPLAGVTLVTGVSGAADALLVLGDSPRDGRGAGRQPPTPRGDSNSTAVSNGRLVSKQPRGRPLLSEP